MQDNREYDKFTKLLLKEIFTINELRKFIDNDFVANIARELPDKNKPDYTKYAIKLIDGDIYHVYVKQ